MEAKENEKRKKLLLMSKEFITLRLIAELNPKPNDIDSKWKKKRYIV